MEKQKKFFAIYRNEEKSFIHEIIFGKSKKLVKENLRANGFTVKGIFSQKDINNILKYEFTDVNVSDNTLKYLRENLSYWDESN